MTPAEANGRPHPAGIPADNELRLLIREVLSDALPALRDRLAAGNGAAASTADARSLAERTAGAGAFTNGLQVALRGAVALPDAPPTAIPAGAVDDADAPPDAGGREAHRTTAFWAAATRGGRAAAKNVTPRAAPDRGVAVRHVRLETDEDVRQFALDIVRLADNPARRADLIAGRLQFTLARSPAVAAQRAEHRVDAGAVTERAVQAAAKAGQRLVLGPRAVLTPLARDRALALGVPIEKER
jgi:hypothetical protein